MGNTSLTTPEVLITLATYLLAWISWGTILFKLIHRLRLVEKKAVLFGFVATMLLVITLSIGYATMHSGGRKKVKITPLYAWGMIGLCMGFVGAINAERRSRQEANAHSNSADRFDRQV